MSKILEIQFFTQEELERVNPLVPKGVMYVEKESLKGKLGNGVNLWNQLSYETGTVVNCEPMDEVITTTTTTSTEVLEVPLKFLPRTGFGPDLNTVDNHDFLYKRFPTDGSSFCYGLTLPLDAQVRDGIYFQSVGDTKVTVHYLYIPQDVYDLHKASPAEQHNYLTQEVPFYDMPFMTGYRQFVDSFFVEDGRTIEEKLDSYSFEDYLGQEYLSSYPLAQQATALQNFIALGGMKWQYLPWIQPDTMYVYVVPSLDYFLLGEPLSGIFKSINTKSILGSLGIIPFKNDYSETFDIVFSNKEEDDLRRIRVFVNSKEVFSGLFNSDPTIEEELSQYELEDMSQQEKDEWYSDRLARKKELALDPSNLFTSLDINFLMGSSSEVPIPGTVFFSNSDIELVKDFTVLGEEMDHYYYPAILSENGLKATLLLAPFTNPNEPVAYAWEGTPDNVMPLDEDTESFTNLTSTSGECDFFIKHMRDSQGNFNKRNLGFFNFPPDNDIGFWYQRYFRNPDKSYYFKLNVFGQSAFGYSLARYAATVRFYSEDMNHYVGITFRTPRDDEGFSPSVGNGVNTFYGRVIEVYQYSDSGVTHVFGPLYVGWDTYIEYFPDTLSLEIRADTNDRKDGFGSFVPTTIVTPNPIDVSCMLFGITTSIENVGTLEGYDSVDVRFSMSQVAYERPKTFNSSIDDYLSDPSSMVPVIPSTGTVEVENITETTTTEYVKVVTQKAIVDDQRNTAELLALQDPIIEEGYLVVEFDTRRAKLGDGETSWNELEYQEKLVVPCGIIPEKEPEEEKVLHPPLWSQESYLQGYLDEDTSFGELLGTTSIDRQVIQIGGEGKPYNEGILYLVSSFPDYPLIINTTDELRLTPIIVKGLNQPLAPNEGISFSMYLSNYASPQNVYSDSILQLGIYESGMVIPYRGINEEDAVIPRSELDSLGDMVIWIATSQQSRMIGSFISFTNGNTEASFRPKIISYDNQVSLPATLYPAVIVGKLSEIATEVVGEIELISDSEYIIANGLLDNLDDSAGILADAAIYDLQGNLIREKIN